MMKTPVFFLLLLLAIFPLSAQDSFEYEIPEPPKPSIIPENPDPPPRQFRELYLGMDLDDLKTALKKDSLFSYRGDRDVSFIPIKEETLVETTGLSYIRRAYFQLHGGLVFIMAFSLDTVSMDHYSVFTSFLKKYGQPLTLSPGEAVWENEDTRVSIERPLTVKYIDKTVFGRLVEESKTGEKWKQVLREEFLEDF